jgi:predicted PhzF superfamily epimerase YddE/YHI9
VGLALAHLARVAHSDGAREAHDGHRLASAGLSALVDVEISTSSGPPECAGGTPIIATHLEQLEGALGARIALTVAPSVVNVGAQWLVAELANASTVRALSPDMAAVTALSLALGRTVGVTVFGRCREADHTVVARSFAPAGRHSRGSRLR